MLMRCRFVFSIKCEFGIYVVVRKSEVLVKVHGPRPENTLFLVHEVFEALIAESFNGVHYDYFIPCMDCIKAVSISQYCSNMWMIVACNRCPQ